MSGISIDRARTALHKAVNLLNEQDRFNIITFGSRYSALFDSEIPATQENLTIAKEMIRRLDANMGGTNMEAALNFAYEGHTHSRDKEREGYLFLITDGEVYDHRGILSRAKKSEMIHFVVGVGYAADSTLLGRLASETGGSYEGMDPNEAMDDAILALFKKIDYPKAKEIQIEWPSQPTISHIPTTLFDGDTLYAAALFKEQPEGEVKLRYCLDDGTTRESLVAMRPTVQDEKKARAITALVITKEIEALKERAPRDRWGYEVDTLCEENKAIIALSTKYQLFSELANYILVDEVADNEKPLDLPTMHRVEHMAMERMAPMRRMVAESKSVASADTMLGFDSYVETKFDEGTLRYLRRRITGEDKLKTFSGTHNDPVQEILDAIAEKDYEVYLKDFETWYLKYGRLPRSKEELREMGLPKELVAHFDTSRIREQVKQLVIELYSLCGDSGFSELFIAYLKNVGRKKEGVMGKASMIVKRLF
jgi:hypothetical protein